MKNTRKHYVAYSISLAGTFLLATCATQGASTMAYWRFESGPANANVISSATGPTWSADISDVSGNGNYLSVWETGGGAGYQYRSDVPFSTVPQTGAANNFSVKNTGGGPAMWTDSSALQTWSPAAWTIEMSFKPQSGGYRTIVGRDSQGAATDNADLAALYFQIQDDSSLAIKFADVQGYWHQAISAANTISGFDFNTDPDGTLGTWYSAAAVSDGNTLSLYLDSGSGYQLLASDDMTLSTSTDTALTPGQGSGGDWTAGNFTVGRGLYAGGHGDRAYGFIDEVRLTDGALTTDQFLGVSPIPEPGTISLILVGAVGLLVRRRFRAGQ